MNCHVRKLIDCTIIASKLKTSLLYDNLYTSHIPM